MLRAVVHRCGEKICYVSLFPLSSDADTQVDTNVKQCAALIVYNTFTTASLTQAVKLKGGQKQIKRKKNYRPIH